MPLAGNDDETHQMVRILLATLKHRVAHQVPLGVETQVRSYATLRPARLVFAVHRNERYAAKCLSFRVMMVQIAAGRVDDAEHAVGLRVSNQANS